jgi:hypothetical protein
MTLVKNLKFKVQSYSLKFKVLIFLSIFNFALLTFNLSGAAAQGNPASANFRITDFTFGGGGTARSDSTNFSILGVAGEIESGQLSSANFRAGTGLVFTLMANVPPAPSFTNPSNFYNKLRLVINQGGNPSDAIYAIAISTDNFAADTRYVQNDNTVGTVLGAEDWQTYALWGGASGVNIIGLSPNTTYTVKVAARRGNFTQSDFGPTAQAATIGPTLSFDIDVAATDIETNPPYQVSIGELTAATVITAANRIWVDIDTNGESGAIIYVYGANNGLLSPSTSYVIGAVSSNLATANEGYGARGSTASQGSGGPMRIISPYNGTGDNVGTLDTLRRAIFDSSSLPVVAGRASFEIKAKASSVALASADYSDTLTVITSASF